MDVQHKVLNAGAMAVAGMVSGKVVDLGWKAVTGHPAPTDPDDAQTTFAELVVFAIISGALLGVARLIAQRSANRYYSGRIEKKLARLSG